jgi:multisubunit Na+/H+ antiporter MnhF subunit
MSMLEWIAAGLLVLAVLLAAVRLLAGPTTPDRVVAADTLAVVTTPALAWVASAFRNPIYLDIALVYGALSFVLVVAIARALEGSRA